MPEDEKIELTQNESTKKIILDLEKYNELINIKMKYEQYKRFVYEKSTKIDFKLAMMVIESENWFNLTIKMEEAKKSENKILGGK